MRIRVGWLTWMTVITLSIEPSIYHVTFTPNPANAEVRLVIFSDTNQQPYQAIHSVQVDEDQSVVDFPRHYLPRGSYVVSAQVMRWDGCELWPADISDSVIVHVP